MRVLVSHFFDCAAQVAAGDQRVMDIQQVFGFEHAVVCRQIHQLADVMRRADGQVLSGEQLTRLAGFSQPLASLLIASGRRQGPGQLGGGGEIAEARQPFEDFRIFEDMQGFCVHV